MYNFWLDILLPFIFIFLISYFIIEKKENNIFVKFFRFVVGVFWGVF